MGPCSSAESPGWIVPDHGRSGPLAEGGRRGSIQASVHENADQRAILDACHERIRSFWTSTATCCSCWWRCIEERSVTRAAQRLGVTQSAVSHLLDKLRGIVGDPLFVKSGRGIVPTAHAPTCWRRGPARCWKSCAPSATAASTRRGSQACFTIAANDLQRDLLLPAAAAPAAREAPGVTLRVIPSGVPHPEMLREELPAGHHPRPPDGSDLLQKRLFEDRYRVFYDPACSARAGGRSPTTSPPSMSPCSTRRAPPRLDQLLAERGRAAPRRRQRAGLRRPGPSCAAARGWPRCPACCAPSCCAALRGRAGAARPARRCRCTWSGTAPPRRPGAPLAARRAAGGGCPRAGGSGGTVARLRPALATAAGRALRRPIADILAGSGRCVA
jgi:DNA-binding transcriptional LysR family regulator